MVIKLTQSFIAFTEQHAHKNTKAISCSETENMLFIVQKKPTRHICNNKDILANINLHLNFFCDNFVHRVASSNLPSLVMLIADYRKNGFF